MRLPSEHQLQTISYIEENLEIKFKGKTHSDASWFISNNIEASKKIREKKKKEGIKFLFELCEQLFENDKEKLEKIKDYKKLY